MALAPRSLIQYKSNRLPSRLRGRKAFDAISGFATQDFRLVPDAQGNLVDPRFGTLDSLDNLEDAPKSGRRR